MNDALNPSPPAREVALFLNATISLPKNDRFKSRHISGNLHEIYFNPKKKYTEGGDGKVKNSTIYKGSGEIQRIKSKYPDEPLPSDGILWGNAKIENGLIKPIQGKGNTFAPDFVVTTDFKLLLGKKHHYLGQSGDVQAAGTIKVVKGKVKRISNDSGHYLPSLEQAKNFPVIFERLGLDLKNTSLELYYIDGAGSLKRFTKFLK